MTKKNRKILLIIMGISLFCDLLIVGLFLSVAAPPWPETPIDYDDPESLYLLAERTEQYIIRANPDKDSPTRKDALKALEDIALLDLSYDEKAKLIRERFPEESFWTDDLKDVLKQAEAGDAEAQFLLGCSHAERSAPGERRWRTRWESPRRRSGNRRDSSSVFSAARADPFPDPSGPERGPAGRPAGKASP